MPTGVPLPDVDGRLLAAAWDVLRESGPAGLTSRAVASRAGVAKGVLHRHFADFDGFLAALVVTRLDRLDAEAGALRARVGNADVATNVAAWLRSCLDDETRHAVALVLGRPSLAERLLVTTPAGVPLLAEVARALAVYLTDERGLGRLAADTDVDGLAIALVGGAWLADADRFDDVVAATLQRPTPLPRC